MKYTLLAALLAIVGCSKPESPTPAIQTVESTPAPAYQKRLDELTAAVKVGMSEEEVVKAIGQPNRTKSNVASYSTGVAWEYSLGDNNYFKVRFNQNNRVASAKFESAFRIQ